MPSLIWLRFLAYHFRRDKLTGQTSGRTHHRADSHTSLRFSVRFRNCPLAEQFKRIEYGMLRGDSGTVNKPYAMPDRHLTTPSVGKSPGRSVDRDRADRLLKIFPENCGQPPGRIFTFRTFPVCSPFLPGNFLLDRDFRLEIDLRVEDDPCRSG